MEEPSRRPRFRRAANLPPIQLTVRDAHIIRQVHRHRFLRSNDIATLFGGSAQPVLRRLQRLYHHGYLDRPAAQLDYFREGGNRTMAYALGNRGAVFLHERFGIPRPRGNWAGKNHSVTRIFLEHTLLVSHLMIAFEKACWHHSQTKLIQPDELLATIPAEQRKRNNPFQWSVNVKGKEKPVRLGIAPDKVFALRFSDRGPERNTAFFFLEADRATMPLARRTLYRTSFARKLIAYHQTWKQNLHQARFNFPRFRVLTVTTSKERATNLAALSHKLTDGKGSGLFLFTDIATLATHGDPLTLPWQTGREGREMPIL